MAAKRRARTRSRPILVNYFAPIMGCLVRLNVAVLVVLRQHRSAHPADGCRGHYIADGVHGPIKGSYFVCYNLVVSVRPLELKQINIHARMT